MVTDAPSGGMEFDEEMWDAARIARHDALYTSSGRTMRGRGTAHRHRRAVRVQQLVVGKALAADGGSARDSVVVTDPLPDGLLVATLPHGDGWDCGATVVGSDQVRCGYAIARDRPLAPGTALPPLTVPVAVAPDATGERASTSRR